MELEQNTNPFALFGQWFEEAVASEINDPDAIALASVDRNGMPSVRMVLLKQWSPDGFVFYTNYNVFLFGISVWSNRHYRSDHGSERGSC